MCVECYVDEKKNNTAAKSDRMFTKSYAIYLWDLWTVHLY